MTIRVALNHKTTYKYDRLVNLGPQTIRLRPAPHCRTPVTGYSLRLTPGIHFLNWQQDPQSNYLARVVFPEKTREFEVEVDLVAELAIINPFDFFLEKAAERAPFTYDPKLAHELKPYLEVEPAGKELAALLAKVDRRERGTVDFLVDLNRLVHRHVSYVIRMEPGVQTPEETLTLKKGSCRDSAWLLVHLLRHLKLAARFVSGYLIQLAPDVKSLDGPSGTEVDFTDLHAWTEVYLPGAGWVGMDPTSGLFAGEGHIPLACSPEPGSAAPITGVVDEAGVEFDFSMSITRIEEAARVTKPYTEEQWEEIVASGDKVEEKLVAGDVRLTMGGEPTFVSIDDFEGGEWNVDALGPTKRGLANTLVRRLKERYAPQGVLHYGQGKWYPGESLPRWALGCFWRADGEPLWQNQKYLADENVNYGITLERSEDFLQLLAEKLKVSPENTLAAFEDPWYWMWRERRLPINVDPLENQIDDPEERERMSRVFDKGLDTPTGFVLPLECWMTVEGPLWQAKPWKFRSKRVFLTPGDSPVGYRLPLQSLPWVRKEDYPYHFEEDPFAPRPPLAPAGSSATVMAQVPGRLPVRPLPPPDPRMPSQPAGNFTGVSMPGVIRTALSVEVRDGRLYIFMPPQSYLEAWVDLIAKIEETAIELDMPVVLEGYGPPKDWRLKNIMVTPDPGVIEVNIHPSRSWRELVEITTTLYEDARQTRLASEKFMVDGRHVGTGGGNHIVVGGARPEDSPFLRRPHLLRSLISYWQNHPSLSYLFSGMFIGPTSQAPRIDEARHDALYELEIAFRQVPDHTDVPSWLVDRLFRHLLADVTGNTHRSEFCIDKLYSPDSSSGRLGLLELRAFEMPPHARMSCVQQLLLRALIAHFWNNPYPPRLVRWGTELHDRFLLPHFVSEDLDDVVADLKQWGFTFERSWLDPHFEFRFPHYGTIHQRGLTLELRQALEPWHVLGEEGFAGGTVRFVDSSVERIQVKVNGMTDGRHAVAVNGYRVPLTNTGREGEYVAAVRFRAWQPASALHPTIPPHGPLVFDIVDEWSNRAIGGCTYHVSHPGGRNFVTAPVNAYEAEGRRLARFFGFGHTPGPMTLGPVEVTREFPLTLDLRRQ